MKRAILTVTVLIVMGWSLLAYSQRSYQFVRADIPFTFQVAGHTLPPGTYDFCWNRQFIAAVRLADMSTKTEHTIEYVTISAVEAPSENMQAMVVFHRIGTNYFLSEIRHPGEAVVSVTMSSQERNLQHLATSKVDVQAEAGK